MGKQRQDEDSGGLGHGSRVWEAPDGSRWRVVTRWADIDGRAECVGLELHAIGDARVKSKLLRWFPMSVVEQARQSQASNAERGARMARSGAKVGRLTGEEYAAALDEQHKAFVTPQGRRLLGEDGQPLPTADALAEVARIYRDAWAKRRNPTKAVAEALSLSRSAAAKRVRRARDAGLLPETSRGRATAADETGV